METEEDQVAGGALSQLGGANLPASTSPSPLQELSTDDQELDALMRMVYDEEPPPGQTAGSLEDELITQLYADDKKDPPPADQKEKKDEKSRKEAFELPPSPLGQFKRDISRLQRKQKKLLGEAATSEREALGAEKKLNERIQKAEDFRSRRLLAEKAELEEAETIRQNSIRDARIDISNATDMVLNSEIDPNRIYKSTGQKVGAALAMALGAAGAALTGTENGAMRILETAIDRDIAAQRMEIESLKFVVGQKQNAYSMLRDEHGDDRKTEEIMRAMGHQHIDNIIQQLKVQYNLDANQSRLTAIEAKNKASMAAVEERLVMARFHGGMTEWSTNMQLIGRAGTGAGSTDYGLSGDLKTKLSGAIMSRKMIDKLLKSAEGLGATTGVLTKISPIYHDADAFQTEVDALAMRVINALSGATFTDAQFEAVKKRLPFKGDKVSTKKLKLQNMRDEMEKNIASIGELVPVELQQGFNKRYLTPTDEAQLAEIEGS